MSPETATVYRALDGKRFFTKKAAILRDVVFRMKAKSEKYGCDDELRGGEHHQRVYWTQEQFQHFRNVANRYYQRFGRVPHSPAKKDREGR